MTEDTDKIFGDIESLELKGANKLSADNDILIIKELDKVKASVDEILSALQISDANIQSVNETCKDLKSKLEHLISLSESKKDKPSLDNVTTILMVVILIFIILALSIK